MGHLTTSTITTIIFILEVNHSPITSRRSSIFFHLGCASYLWRLHKETQFSLDVFQNKLQLEN